MKELKEVVAQVGSDETTYVVTVYITSKEDFDKVEELVETGISNGIGKIPEIELVEISNVEEAY